MATKKKPRSPAPKAEPTLAELNADLYAARQEMQGTQYEVVEAQKRLRAARSMNTIEHRLPVVAQRQAELVEALNAATEAKARFESLRERVRRAAR